MLKRTTLFSIILFAALSLTMAGCLPGAGSGDNNDDSNVQTGGNNGGGNNGGGNNGNGSACTVGEDCPYHYCNCTDGGVVNSRRCDNNECAPAAEVCPDSCAQFDSEWDGTVSQLPEEDAGTTEDAGMTEDARVNDAGSDLQCLDGQLDDTDCNRCIDSFCCFELEECFNSDQCASYGQCIQQQSPSACAEQFPDGQFLWEEFASCQETNCPQCSQ